MPALIKTEFTKTFQNVVASSKEKADKNDCAFKAVAVVTGRAYSVVHKAFETRGRDHSKPTPFAMTQDVLKEFGYTVRKWTPGQIANMIQNYPKPHSTILKQITSHHPRRFEDAWLPHAEKTLLFRTKSHILAVKDNKVHDWSINNKLHVREVYEVIAEGDVKKAPKPKKKAAKETVEPQQVAA